MPTVSKNIFWSTLTSALQLYTGSVVFIVLAKLMPVEDFGVLSFGFSLSSLVVIVADFGFSLMIMKDYPQKETGHNSYVTNGVLAKMGLSLLGGCVFLVYLSLFYVGEWFSVGAIYILFSLVASFIIYLQALMKAQNRFHKFMESTMVYAIGVTISILLYWQVGLSLVNLVCCLLLSKIIQLLWAVLLCSASFKRFKYDKKLIFRLVKNSWSFGLHTVLGIFYFMVDTQIISLYLGARDVALYQSVFRIILILLVFSEIVSNVLLPYLSFKYYKDENLSELIAKIFLYLLIIGCSLFLLFTSFKTKILEVLYTPEYQEAAILVLPFSIVVILRTISSLLGNILTISNKQVYRVLTVFVSLVVSLILNFIFIPKYGILAAAWISVLVHLVMFIMYFVFSKLEVPSIQLGSRSNIILIMVTTGIYIFMQNFGQLGLWVVFGCIIVWMTVVYIIMGQNNNSKFLKQVLGEKGVG